MGNIGFEVKTDKIDETWKTDAEYLLSYKDRILKALAKKGMHEDATSPYVYYMPVKLSFDCGKEIPMDSIYAVVLMARASYAAACFLDVDEEGYPELPKFCGGEEGFHRVYISDPFARQIDDAIKEHRATLLKEGKPGL